MSKKTKGQELAEKLVWKAPNIAKEAPKQIARQRNSARAIKSF